MILAHLDKTRSLFVKVSVAAVLIAIGVAEASAQNRIRGSVHSKSEPVPYASVTAIADSTSLSAIKGYAITNDKGEFEIDAGIEASDWIVVRCLGYKEAKSKLGDTSRYFKIEMEEDEHLLNEVTVKGNYSGLRFSSDTISIDTKLYASGTEENIGEVLRKVPGMEVSESGKVSYAGRTLQKVLIDGKDILSSNKNLAIKNLPANLMESAEVLMNYKEKSITNDFENDETAALNIKTTGQHALNGSAQLSGGYLNKFQAKSALLQMSGKGSFSAMLSANNTGAGVFSIEEYINSIVGIDNLLSQNKSTYSLSSDEANLLYPPSNVYENTNGVLSLNSTYEASEKFSFKGNAIYNGSFLKASSQSEEQYFSGDVMNLSNEYNDNKNHYLSAGFKESWKPGERFELNASTNFSLSRYLSREVVGNSILGRSMSSDNNNAFTGMQFVQDLSSNLLLGSGILYTYIHFEMANRDGNYDIESDSMLLGISYLPNDDGIYPYLFSNKSLKQTTEVSSEIGYVFPLLGNVNLNASLAYQYSGDRLAYSENEAAAEQDKSRTHKYMASVRLEKNKGLLRFGLGGKFSINDFHESISNRSKLKGTASPELSMNLVFTPRHRLNLAASYDTDPVEVHYLSQRRRVTGYDNIVQGSTLSKFFSNEANISMNYSIYDLYTNTTFFVLASYANKSNLPLSSISQDGITSSITYRDGGKREVGMARFYLNKGISFMPVDAKLTGSFSQTNYNVVINDSENRVKGQNLGAGLSFTSRYKSPFNAELEVSYNYRNTSLPGTSVKNDIHEWTTTGRLHYSRDRFKASVYASYLNSESMYYNQSTVDLGFSSEYKIGKVGIRASGENLLHLKDMEWIGVYDSLYYTSTSLYKKIPGNVQLGLSYRF